MTKQPCEIGHLSGLSSPSQRPLDKNLDNISETYTDKPHDGGHLSVLSVPPGGSFIT